MKSSAGSTARLTLTAAIAAMALSVGCGAPEEAPAPADGQAKITLTSSQTGTDGLWYSFWTDGGGSVQFELLGGGRYASRWTNVNNWVGGKGWRTGSRKVVSYSGTFNSPGNGYLALYGWTTNPLVEYYVVENFGTYNPSSGSQLLGSLNSDGGTYNLYRTQRVNQPSIIGTATFYQYWAVRTVKRTGGTITTGNFFDAWGRSGLTLGTHDYMVLATEGYQSSGSSDITVSEGTSPNTFALTVTKSGSGSGTVTSNTGGINCGSTCSANLTSGTTVTLSAAPASGATFGGWSGACSGTGSCVVTMSAARTVTATFNGSSTTPGVLAVNAGGAAAGDFAADANFSGGSTYSNTSTIDTSRLTGTVPPQSVFQSERYGEFSYTFSGLTAGSAQAVSLYFAETYWTAAGQRTFNVAINGATVLTAYDIFAQAGGANRAIARTFNTTANASGQVVVQFTRGGGPDNPKVNAIAVAASVTTNTLTVSKAGDGSGTVSSTPAGVNCGATCSASYTGGTVVTLTAAAASGSSFGGWSGCSGSGTTCTVTMNAAQAVTATFTAAPISGTGVSVNAGGSASGSFAADAYFSGGSTYSTTSAIDTSQVTGAVPPAAVFQSERYGEFTYTIPNREAGSAQMVTLFFAESYWTAAGQRTFNVAINGATVLSAFDIFAQAGGANRAIARTFNTTANASGQVVIQFTRAGGPDNPKVCGLTVASGPVIGDSYTLSVTRSGTGGGTVSGAGIDCGSTCSASYASGTTVTLTATPAAGSTFGGWSGACTGTGSCVVTMTAARSVTAAFTQPTSDSSFSVNAGGSAAGGFVADAYYSGGSTYTTTSTINTSLLTGDVPPAAVFQSERYGEFTYTIPNRTAGTTQTVTLYFAESYWTAAGQRTFNVAINGATVLSAFDIFAQAGGANRAISRTFTTTANASGQVVVQFTRGGGPDNPKICGITVSGGGAVGDNYTLSVAKSGTGAGTVSGAGINCGSTCSASFASGTSVTLTATPNTGSTFGGWSGACTGTGSCIVSMTAARSVTATFNGGGTDTCTIGATRGSEVAVIGDSFIAMSHGITQEIERLARAAGSLGANDRYVDNSVSGTTLANNQIPGQYTRAVQSSGTIKYVLMDGGGNDCLINNNADAAYNAAQQLFQTMAQNRTEKVVYFFYPDPVGSNYASLKSCLDGLRPRMKALCDGLSSPKCYWLDLRPTWNGHPEYTSDGIHPTSQGSVVTGQAVWQTMRTNCVAQ